MYFLSETSCLGAFVAQFSCTSLCHEVTKAQRNHEVRNISYNMTLNLITLF